MSNNDWIIRYEVYLIDTGPGSEMYGHDRFIRSFENDKDAIAHAKSLMPRHNNVCVLKVRYASERNLARRFSFDSNVMWCAWLDASESA
ncbi:MAG: hypothetical protein J6Y20_07480 [Lachnospiraceae bacterium]|nr:hypothetical protein [Lachnospiraceae bacterium]